MIKDITMEICAVQAKMINHSFTLDKEFGLATLKGTVELFERIAQLHSVEDYHTKYQFFLIDLLRQIDPKYKNDIINNIPLPFMSDVQRIEKTVREKCFGL
jgi:hypothetical protein